MKQCTVSWRFSKIKISNIIIIRSVIIKKLIITFKIVLAVKLIIFFNVSYDKFMEYFNS